MQQTQVLYLVPKFREKKLDRKRKNLIRLGIPTGQTYAWSRTRMGGWAVAQSPILRTTITLRRLKKRGYQSLVEHYLNVSPLLNEPLPKLREDPYVRWCAPKGCLWQEAHWRSFDRHPSTRLATSFMQLNN